MRLVEDVFSKLNMFLFRKQRKQLSNNTNNTNNDNIYFGMKIRQRDIMDYVKINTLRNKMSGIRIFVSSTKDSNKNALKYYNGFIALIGKFNDKNLSYLFYFIVILILNIRIEQLLKTRVNNKIYLLKNTKDVGKQVKLPKKDDSQNNNYLVKLTRYEDKVFKAITEDVGSSEVISEEKYLDLVKDKKVIDDFTFTEDALKPPTFDEENSIEYKSLEGAISKKCHN